MLTLKQSFDMAKQHGFYSLITQQHANAKLAKATGFYNAGISLSQAKTSGHNMCPGSTAACRLACLGGTGRAEHLAAIPQARIAKTKLFATNRQLFWEILEPQLHAIDRKAKKLGLPVAFRPNILSDQNWPQIYPQLFDIFSHWQFYGYTKVKSYITQLIDGKLPSNYYLTYSWSERADIKYVRQIAKHGVNTAVPFYHSRKLKPYLPQKWYGLKVIDGDKSDLRFQDESGVIVGLRVKLPKKLELKRERIKQAKGFFVGVAK